MTGGARGIGKGIVLELAQAGADALIADRLEDAMRATADEVRGGGLHQRVGEGGHHREEHLSSHRARPYVGPPRRCVEERGRIVEESWACHQITLIPQGRAQTPQDMGRPALFFATTDNVTGQSVNVDGGLTFH